MPVGHAHAAISPLVRTVSLGWTYPQVGQGQRRVLPGLGDQREGGLRVGGEKLLRRAQVDAECGEARLCPVVQVPLHPAGRVQFLTEPRTEPYGQVAVFRDIAGNKWDLIGPAL